MGTWVGRGWSFEELLKQTGCCVTERPVRGRFGFEGGLGMEIEKE